MKNYAAWCACLCFCLVASGCGKKDVAVTGAVTYNGERLKSGEVRFFASGVSRTALINSDGTYSISDCVAGEAKVAVVSSKSETPAAAPQIGKVGTAINIPVSAIPQKYGDPETSNLLYTLKRGSQKIDIDLTD